MRLPSRAHLSIFIFSLLAANLLPCLVFTAAVQAREELRLASHFPQPTFETELLSDWDQTKPEVDRAPAPVGSQRSFHHTAIIVFVIGIITVLLLWTLSQV